MALISLGKIDKSLIPTFVGCGFLFLNRLLNKYSETLLFKNIILTNIFISVSRILAFIPYLILKKRTKQKKNIDKEQSSKAKFLYLYTDEHKMINEGKWKYITLSAVTNFIQTIFFVYSFKVQTNAWIWFIVLTSLFYYLVFKIKLYKHHYLCIILIILLGIIIDILLDSYQIDIEKNMLFLIMKFLREVVLSFHFVIVKYAMEKKFISVYEMSVDIGVSNLILFGIFSIIDYYTIRLDNLDEYANEFNYIELLIILGEISSQFFCNLSILLTLKNNSPCHIFILFVFAQLAYYINFERKYSIIVIILLFIILFLSLIFNEIIEINCFGLSYNTKRNISERAMNEGKLTHNDSIDSNNVDGYMVELPENEIYN